MTLTLSKRSWICALPTRRVGRVRIELRWNGCVNGDGPELVLDLSAFALGASLKIPSDSYFVFCGSDSFQVSEDRSIMWDDTSDDAIVVDFSLVSPMIDQIIICATICKYPNDRNRDKRTVNLYLGMIDDCYTRVLDAKSDEELARWPVPQTSGSEDGVVFGRLVRVGSVWELEAIGSAHAGGLEVLVDLYT